MITKLLLILAISISPAFAGIGKVVEQSGNSVQIKKKSGGEVQSKLNIDVDSYDIIITGKDKARINFVDNTKVQVTENSRLVLDEFVYDPKNSDASKLGMKVLVGTVRYASGQIAKQNKQAVDIQTPTATIAVRGTDFSMSVDEIGRSLVVLLPSCNDKGQCYTGAIDVITAVGKVTIEEAFVATYVASAQSMPTEPVKLNMGVGEINNDLMFRKDDGGSNKNQQKKGKESVEQQDSIAAMIAQLDAESKDKSTSIIKPVQKEELLKTSSAWKYTQPWYIYSKETTNESVVQVRTQNNTVLNIVLDGKEITETVGDQSGTKITINQKK